MNALPLSILPVVFTVLSLLGLPQSVHADSRNWWSTAEQKAEAAMQAGDYEKLKTLAPDKAWKGVAEHGSGDFSAAASTFAEVAREQELAGNGQAASQALYNQGVSEVRDGQYEQAVETFDQVLAADPQFVDAQHNRDIARQLIQQQQQQQQQQNSDQQQDQDGDSSSSEDGEQQSESSDSEQAQDQSGEQSESDNSEAAEQGQNNAQAGDSDEDSANDSQAQQDADEQAAREALEAEAQARAKQDEAQSDDDGQASAADQREPLSESEQATEQWLRRIPDDPAGLLKRKLEQSHRTEYPEVGDAREPW